MFATAVQPAPTVVPRRRALRFTHLTDVHVQPELNAAKGLATCLAHVQSQTDRVESILFGGDAVMDVFAVDAPRIKLLADLWHSIFKQDCSLPVRTCIGNHDVRPWSKRGDDGLLSKAWALDMLGLERRYYAFDQAGWRFLVLDSIQPSGNDYTSGIDAEQFAWLEQELKNGNESQPVVIVSHIPIFTLTTLTYQSPRVAGGAQQIPGYLMMLGGTAIHYLLREHPNVKLCLSGHLHLCDRCEIDGVTYIHLRRRRVGQLVERQTPKGCGRLRRGRSLRRRQLRLHLRSLRLARSARVKATAGEHHEHFGAEHSHRRGFRYGNSI
jgi:Icc protein